MAGVPSKSVGAYPSQLNEKGYLKSIDGKYRLTSDGKERYAGFIDLPNQTDEPRAEEFITVPSPDDDFYAPLIEDIEFCYEQRVDDAVMVLTRKLLENLVIDCMRSHFGVGEGLDLFYNKDEGRFNFFSVLVENFGEHTDQFQVYSSVVDDEFVSKLDSFRDRANAPAHTIEIRYTDEELEELGERASHLVEILFVVKDKAESVPKDFQQINDS